MPPTSPPPIGPTAKITASTLAYFALPTITYGYMFCLVSLYFLKFATDILLIAPAIMGVIFGISRIWDAISDPLVGYWSDRTNSRWGRRRPWIAVCALPTALTFLMLFSPLSGMENTALVVWVSIGIIGFLSASTLLYVPHMALGAELSDDYHERSKIFAARHAGWIGGYIVGIGGIALLSTAAIRSRAEVLDVAATQAIFVAPLAAISLLLCAWRLKERKGFADKGSRQPIKALLDVLKNRHVRPPLLAYFFDNIGFAFAGTLALYIAEYVLDAPLAAPKFFLAFLIPSFAFTPVWLPLSRRFGKKHMWIFSMCLSACAYGAMFFIGKGDENLLILLGALAGLANSAGHVIGPSLLSDVVDYDEYKTGERKEGAYFAAWNFTWKTANGITLMMIGIILSWVGFVPNVEQTVLVFYALKVMFAIVPFFFYMCAAFVFRSYQLNETTHKELHANLAMQRQDSTP